MEFELNNIKVSLKKDNTLYKDIIKLKRLKETYMSLMAKCNIGYNNLLEGLLIVPFMNNYITEYEICEFINSEYKNILGEINHIEKTFNHNSKHTNFLKLKFTKQSETDFKTYLFKLFKAYQEICKNYSRNDTDIKNFIDTNFKLIINNLKRQSKYHYS